jgi:hypothetical protein
MRFSERRWGNLGTSSPIGRGEPLLFLRRHSAFVTSCDSLEFRAHKSSVAKSFFSSFAMSEKTMELSLSSSPTMSRAKSF